MIESIITEDGVPAIAVEVGSQRWQAIIDTGFNGELELPERLRSHVNARFVGRATSLLAVNQRIEEEVFLVDFAFDGRMVRERKATFVDGDEILIGSLCCGIIGCRSIFLPGPFSSRSRMKTQSLADANERLRLTRPERVQIHAFRVLRPWSLLLKKSRIARSSPEQTQSIRGNSTGSHSVSSCFRVFRQFRGSLSSPLCRNSRCPRTVNPRSASRRCHPARVPIVAVSSSSPCFSSCRVSRANLATSRCPGGRNVSLRWRMGDRCSSRSRSNRAPASGARV